MGGVHGEDCSRAMPFTYMGVGGNDTEFIRVSGLLGTGDPLPPANFTH